MTISIAAPITSFVSEPLPLSAEVIADARAQFDAVRDRLSPGTWAFIADHVHAFDPDHQRTLAKAYRRAVESACREQIAGRYVGSIEAEANNKLREYRQLYQIHDLCLTAADSEVVAFCDARANECRRIISAEKCDGRRLRMLCAVMERYRLQWLAPASVLEFGPLDLLPTYRRLSCCRWWRRQVRKLQAREVEKVARMRQKVGRGRDLYCSDWNVKRAKRARKRNQETLSAVEAVNDEGDVYTLDELQALGVSNPGVRRKELMTRMRGFEEVAALYGHAGEFWTFTTPSRFHRMTVVGGSKKKRGILKPNAKWDGSTPADGQAWLCEKWSRIRAAFERRGVRCYGFRVAEPHHDGTPHWHLILFFNPDQVSRARRIARRHLWLSDCPDERGAWRRRFDAKVIGGVGKDGKPRTATGYLAKYVAKNINAAHCGDLLSDEDEGKTLGDAVPRVLAWASTWGIRQFQQIGGPSVTVWRELRRLDGYDSQLDMFGTDAVEEVVTAADEGDWFSYVIAMGGPTLPRAARFIQPAYWIESRQRVGRDGGMPRWEPGREITEYGDPAKGSVFGVWALGAAILTRLYRWTLRMTREAVRGFQMQAAAPPALDLCQ